jgi:hypothetical protein
VLNAPMDHTHTVMLASFERAGAPVVRLVSLVGEGHVVSYSQQQEGQQGQHVLMYEEDGVREWEGWGLPDPECIYQTRNFGCQIHVSDDMLPSI